ncbi:MAG: hypothetical protein JW920_00630 [Deltaproteobacteria bacterium]|nr:hypothetical protein [Deltaproteobacteria bacterium]
MIPWEHHDSTPVPGNDETLGLFKRGKEFSIRLGGCELMNSRIHGSEDVLAELACAKIFGFPRPRVLIGGLGMGYTLAAALNRLGNEAQVIVAELLPAVVKWNRGPLAYLAGHPLEDKRATVREIDVAQIIQESQQAFNAILLDVDNGPEGLTRQDNDWLYTRAGIEAAFTALRPAGVLAVWSAGSDRGFTRRLQLSGFEVNEIRVRAQSRRKGWRHTIWTAVRSS